MNRGLAIVISGPSGAGKSTILKKTTARIPGMVFSVSCTTRNPRPGESDNVDYHFISTSQFEEGIRKGDFLEYADVHGNYYGTPKAPMLKVVEECGIMLLDIDVQGARQIRENLSGTPLAELVEYVFVAPPSLTVLEERLRKRGTESPESLARRIADAREEMEAASEYGFVVVNEDSDQAARQLEAIIVAATCQTCRNTTLQED